MFKKVLFALGAVSLLSFVSSCGEKEKIYLSYKINYESVDSIYNEEKTYEQFSLACNTKTSFVAVVYSDKTCSCYVNLKNASKKYIYENGIDLYNINNDSFYAKESYGYVAPSFDFPVILLINEGKVEKQLNYETDNKIFFVDSSFSTFISDNCELPKINKINKKYIETVKKNDEIILYFGNSKCPDCLEYFTKVLKPFIKSNFLSIKNNIIYYVDRQECNFTTDEEWNAFKDNNYISNVYDKTYGYDQGFVPTIQYYKNGVLSSANVFLNDTLENNKVTNTYYTKERINNLEYLKGKDPVYQVFISGEDTNKNDLLQAHIEIGDIFLSTYILY